MQFGGDNAVKVIKYNKDGLSWATIAVLVANPSTAL
jgi:hypothetical protein